MYVMFPQTQSLIQKSFGVQNYCHKREPTLHWDCKQCNVIKAPCMTALCGLGSSDENPVMQFAFFGDEAESRLRFPVT